MLVLKVKPNGKVFLHLPDGRTVTVVLIPPFKLGVEAPADVVVLREELENGWQDDADSPGNRKRNHNPPGV